MPLFREPDGADPLLQGDIWFDLPFLLARRLPMVVTRRHNDAPGGRATFHGYVEGGKPEPKEAIHLGYRAGGDDVIAQGFLCSGVVLSHDCEIENSPDHVLVAPLLPWANLSPEHQGEAANGLRRDVFPVLAQQQPVVVANSYIKFSRVTVVHRDVFGDCTRLASATTQLRTRLAVAFYHYLLHPEDT